MYVPIGKYTNIKLTTPDDLQIAEQILKERNITNYDDIKNNLSENDNNDNTDIGNNINSSNSESSSYKSNDEKDSLSYACSSERYRDNLSKVLSDDEKIYIENKKTKKYFF